MQQIDRIITVGEDIARSKYKLKIPSWYVMALMLKWHYVQLSKRHRAICPAFLLRKIKGKSERQQSSRAGWDAGCSKKKVIVIHSIRCDLPRNLDKIKIVLFADWHFGAKECDLKIIREQIKQAEEPDTYAIIMGDLIDNATINSVGDTYQETVSPMEQLETVKGLILPVKDKILGGVAGNHCFRTYKTEGIDLMYFLFNELGIPDRYDQNSMLLFVRVGEDMRGHHMNKDMSKLRQVCYSMYVAHGSSGGRLPGGKANALSRMGQIVNADICLLAHSHLPLAFRESTYQIDYTNSTCSAKETLFINASSTLSFGGYAERWQLRPVSLRYPVISLDGRRKYSDVII